MLINATFLFDYHERKCGNPILKINGVFWKIMFVSGNSDCLKRSDGSTTVGVTDMATRTVYLNRNLRGFFLRKVLCHEIVHCFCFSYGVVLPIETEEIVADFVATYGTDVIALTDTVLKDMLAVG